MSWYKSQVEPSLSSKKAGPVSSLTPKIPFPAYVTTETAEMPRPTAIHRG